MIAGLMTTNIGNCPDTKVKDLALVDDLSEEIRWLLAISEHHRRKLMPAILDATYIASGDADIEVNIQSS